MGRREERRASVARALAHHELTGVVLFVSPPGGDQPGWRIQVRGGDVCAYTTSEAEALCIGMAAAERVWRTA